ncbi:metallophosphoesterase [Mesorhizobium sp. ASY16-5R]|uniref:metallophosphoesterase n=1 Tax=Mesorhizobium sp. ASY16-5R TaxID=3445772 RepID=UPI003F9FB89D
MVNRSLPDPLGGLVAPSRRRLIGGALAGLGAMRVRGAFAQTGEDASRTDATFLFSSDIHACRTADGLSPNCQEEGKTDANLLRHIAGLNGLEHRHWPETVNGAASRLASAGERIGRPRGLVIGGDMTDDGGGQIALPREGTQLLQFSHRYREGVGPERVHFPVYAGLGNHDLDQDGLPPHADWYRRELRDYVEINHRPSVFFKPPVPADNYDAGSDCYSWNWGRLHLVQSHRFAGDTTKGAVSGLPWLKADLAAYAGDGRPVVLFQHYGWDPFSMERWDPAKSTFDDEGSGAPHWWSDADRRAMLDVLKAYTVIAVFHGHQHETPMIYRRDGLDLFKPKAAYMGGFALVRVTDRFIDVVLGETAGEVGEVIFTDAFSKPLPG